VPGSSLSHRLASTRRVALLWPCDRRPPEDRLKKVRSLKAPVLPSPLHDHSPATITVTDPRRVLATIAAFDALPGHFASTEPSGCGNPVSLVYTYAVTLHWPDPRTRRRPRSRTLRDRSPTHPRRLHLPQTLQTTPNSTTPERPHPTVLRHIGPFPSQHSHMPLSTRAMRANPLG
jgi:hypothetical protein